MQAGRVWVTGMWHEWHRFWLVCLENCREPAWAVASGMVHQARRAIAVEAEFVIAGGVESMSRAPL